MHYTQVPGLTHAVSRQATLLSMIAPPLSSDDEEEEGDDLYSGLAHCSPPQQQGASQIEIYTPPSYHHRVDETHMVGMDCVGAPPMPFPPPQWPYWDLWAGYRQQFSRSSSVTQRQRVRKSLSVSVARLPDPQKEIFEEQEERLEKETTLVTNISLSSSDEVIMRPPPPTANDFRQFQNFFKSHLKLNSHNTNCMRSCRRRHQQKLHSLSTRHCWTQQKLFGKYRPLYSRCAEGQTRNVICPLARGLFVFSSFPRFTGRLCC